MMQTFEHLENICFQTVTAIWSESNTKQNFCMQKFEKRSEWICWRLEKGRADDDNIKCEYCKKAKNKMFLCLGCEVVHYCCRSHQKKHGGKTTQFYA